MKTLSYFMEMSWECIVYKSEEHVCKTLTKYHQLEQGM